MKEYLTSEELREWIQHPTTKKIQKRFKDIVLNEKLEAAANMGVNQLGDRFKSGYIQGMEIACSYELLFQEEDVQDGTEGKRSQSSY